MDKQRERFVQEIARMHLAMKNTKSERLKRDYRVALKRMNAELADYDAFRRQANEKK